MGSPLSTRRSQSYLCILGGLRLPQLSYKEYTLAHVFACYFQIHFPLTRNPHPRRDPVHGHQQGVEEWRVVTGSAQPTEDLHLYEIDRIHIWISHIDGARWRTSKPGEHL